MISDARVLGDAHALKLQLDGGEHSFIVNSKSLSPLSLVSQRAESSDFL